MNILERDGGYIGNSMSVRAKRAYDSGEKPKSKWTKQEMLEAIYNEGNYVVECTKKLSAQKSTKSVYQSCIYSKKM